MFFRDLDTFCPSHGHTFPGHGGPRRPVPQLLPALPGQPTRGAGLEHGRGRQPRELGGEELRGGPTRNWPISASLR